MGYDKEGAGCGGVCATFQCPLAAPHRQVGLQHSLTLDKVCLPTGPLRLFFPRGLRFLSSTQSPGRRTPGEVWTSYLSL